MAAGGNGTCGVVAPSEQPHLVHLSQKGLMPVPCRAQMWLLSRALLVLGSAG